MRLLIYTVANNKIYVMNNIKAMDIHSQETVVYEELNTSDPSNGQDKIVRAQFEQYLRPYILIIGMLCALLVLEVYRWYTQSPPLPGVFLGLFLVTLTYSVYRIHEYKDHFHFLRLGKNGEPEIAAILKTFSENTDSAIYKDVKFGRDKVDYLITNKAGVYLINLINWHAPVNNEAIINYKEEEILLNGYRPDANPLLALKHITHWLDGKLTKSTNQPVLVQPIIVFPGWFVKTPDTVTTVKVMNPRELSGYLQSRRNVLSGNDKTLLDYQIGKFIKK